MMKRHTPFRQFILVIGLSFLTAACGLFGGDDELEDEAFSALQRDLERQEGVNPFLWRASLDTFSQFPVTQADATGGVIITDWFVNPDAPGERFKLTVFIIDESLRADALNVNVVRQEMRDGIWVNAEVRAGTALQIEDAILARARQLRIRTLEE